MASKGQKFMKLSSKTKKELLKINYQSRLWLKQFRAVKSADDVNYRQLKSYKKKTQGLLPGSTCNILQICLVEYEII